MLTPDSLGLVGVVLVLGFKHGFDADHLAAFDETQHPAALRRGRDSGPPDAQPPRVRSSGSCPAWKRARLRATFATSASRM